MLQIVYFSTAAVQQNPQAVHDISSSWRVNNRREGISGLLVAGGNRYLHVIEGPRAKVETLFARILADDRHLGITVLLRRPILQRCFKDWSMAYRRTPDLSDFDSFPEVVRYLTHQVDNPALRRQIAELAQCFMLDDAALVPTLWKQAC